MARISKADVNQMSQFASWLVSETTKQGKTLAEMAEFSNISTSQLHKILKSYEPRYAGYRRPGYEKTVAIGEFLGDVRTALEFAGYSVPQSAELRIEEQTPSASTNELERIPAIEEMYGELLAARADGILTKKVADQIQRDVIRTLNAERYQRSKFPEPAPEEGQA
jgi:hypothetical protein